MAAVRGGLGRAGPSATIAEVPPSLEDVFLDVVERSARDEQGPRRRPQGVASDPRDRRTLLMLLFVPAFFLLLYGYALNLDIRHMRIAVEDRDRSAESRAMVSAFVNSGYFDLVADVGDAEIRPLMDRGEVRAVLVIPADSGGRRGPAARAVQVIINGDNANTATTVMGYALTILRSEAAELGTRPAGGRAAGIGRPAHLVQPGAAQHAVPGARPDRLHRHDHGGRLDGRVDRPGEGARHDGAGADGADRHAGVRHRQEPAVLPDLARVGDGHHPRGDGAVRAADAGLVARAAAAAGAVPDRRAGLGLLVSTVADSQQVAFQMALLVSFLPTLMLSGFIFPISSMPAALQVITFLCRRATSSWRSAASC